MTGGVAGPGEPGFVSDLPLAGSACRVDNGSPAVVRCGLRPVRRLCPRLTRPGGCARVAELEAQNARLRQAAADRDELAAAQPAAERARADSAVAQVAALAARVEELQRLLGKDSSNDLWSLTIFGR